MRVSRVLGPVIVALAAASYGCSGGTGETDAGGPVDAASMDAAGSDSGPDVDAAPPEDAGSDAASSDAAVSDAGGACDPSGGRIIRPVAIAGCEGLPPGSEDCHFSVTWDESACCPGSPCDRLVVFWAGGNQTCDDDGAFDTILGGFLDRGFIAACAQPYTTDTEGGAYTYVAEWDRMDRVMQRLREEVAPVWTGDKLLISGNSHGGSAPLVAIASHSALRDHAALWTGGTHTAVVLYDGISNPRTLEEWAGAQVAGSGCGLFHRRWVGRYGDGNPILHSCSNAACYCSDPASEADWAADTVVIGDTSPTSPYDCDDYNAATGDVLYRFVSCSGTAGATACGAIGGDIIPDDQQMRPYEALRACSGITASYAQYDCPHILCGGFLASPNCGGDDSVDWLEANGW